MALLFKLPFPYFWERWPRQRNSQNWVPLRLLSRFEFLFFKELFQLLISRGFFLLHELSGSFGYSPGVWLWHWRVVWPAWGYPKILPVFLPGPAWTKYALDSSLHVGLYVTELESRQGAIFALLRLCPLKHIYSSALKLSPPRICRSKITLNVFS